MSSTRSPKDLVILTADKNMQCAVEGVLGRFRSLQIRQLSYDIYVHPYRDPGCLGEGHVFLHDHLLRFDHAIVMLDRQGCGKEKLTAVELEAEIELRLDDIGWNGRATAVVLDPELEIWVWSDSPVVEQILGWSGSNPSLRVALENEGFLDGNAVKPADPKAAMEFALRKTRTPRSSSLYSQLAGSVGLERCTDPSFDKLKSVLRNWFPARLED